MGRKHQASRNRQEALTLVYSEYYFGLEGSGPCQQPEASAQVFGQDARSSEVTIAQQ